MWKGRDRVFAFFTQGIREIFLISFFEVARFNRIWSQTHTQYLKTILESIFVFFGLSFQKLESPPPTRGLVPLVFPTNALRQQNFGLNLTKTIYEIILLLISLKGNTVGTNKVLCQ